MLMFLEPVRFLVVKDETLMHLFFFLWINSEVLVIFFFSHLVKHPIFAQTFNLKYIICYDTDTSNKSKDYILNSEFSLYLIFYP